MTEPATRPAAPARGRAGVAACAALAVAFACTGSSEPARMREAIDPYLDELAAYDRWARRLGLADSAFHSEEALREAAFAPLRRERRVHVAWLTREGPDARRLRYPDNAPPCPEDGWVRVVTEPLGELKAQQRTMTIDGEARALTLIRRTRPAPGEGTLHVTMGFGSTVEP